LSFGERITALAAIKALIRNGHVETEAPIDLPEGTEVLILPAIAREDPGDDWDDSATGIAAWLDKYDALEPLIITSDEKQPLEQDRAARREWELAQAEARARKLREIWESSDSRRFDAKRTRRSCFSISPRVPRSLPA
jgi:hypothetical protein